MPELRDLEVEEVAFVDRAAVRDPANPDRPARFVLYKAESGGDNKPKPPGLTDSIKSTFQSELRREVNNPGGPQRIASGMRRLAQWAASGNYPTGLNCDDLRWLYNQSAAVLKEKDPNSDAGGSFPECGSSPVSKAELVPPEQEERVAVHKCHSLSNALARARGDEPQYVIKEEAMPQLPSSPITLDEALNLVEVSKAELTDAHRARLSAILDSEAPAPVRKEELPPAVRELVEKAEADAKALRERVEKMERERAEEAARVALEKAEAFVAAELTHVPHGEVQDLGQVIHQIRQAAPEAAAKVETVLKAANTALRTSALFSERGTSAPAPSGAEAKIKALATELRKAETGLTEAQAIDRVLQTPEGFALFQQAEAERRGR